MAKLTIAEHLQELWMKSSIETDCKLSVFLHFINSISDLEIEEVSNEVYLCHFDDGSMLEFKRIGRNKVSCYIVERGEKEHEQ